MEDIKKWNFAHTIWMLSAGAASLFFSEINILSIAVFISFCLYLYLHKTLLSTFSPYGGYANRVSLFRWLLMLLGGFMLTQWKVVYSFPFFFIALCLDGVDGYLARKYDQASDFGAYFDMETDAFYVAFLSTFWVLEGRVGAWLLFVGFLRYLYVIALKIFRLEGKKEKSTRFAKTIAVVMMATLLGPFLLPDFVYLPAIIIAALMTVYSFGVSFVSRFGE